MATTIAIERPIPVSLHLGPGTVMPAAAERVAGCCCGQALDACHSGHCPRCGVAIVAPSRAGAAR